MWNSPHSFSDEGKRYPLADLSALILPLDEMLYLSKSEPVARIVGEAILQPLERSEFVYALFQVLEALLEDVEKPAKGHTGIQEAMVAELLFQTFFMVRAELEVPDIGVLARKAAWNSVDRLLIHRNPYAPELPGILEDVGMTLADPQPYLSSKLTDEVWEELLTSEDFLGSEFLWDTDWRLDSLLDHHPDAAKAVTKVAGINLDVVHALAHTPTEAEYRRAEQYISKVISKNEALWEKSTDVSLD